MSDTYGTETAQVARLDERMKTMERDMLAMTEKLDTLHNEMGKVLAALNEARGGWKTLMWLGGAASALGAAVMWFMSNFHIRPGP